MTPLGFVTFKWPAPVGYRSVFSAAQVNTLQRMIARNYPAPHRVFCVTDQAEGIDPGVTVVPDWKDYADLPSPSGRRNPSCYRRLRAFAPEMADTFGPRFVLLDLDTVIAGDLRPLVDRPDDFVIWGDTNPRTYYNGSLILMTAGARSKVWTTFHPIESPRASYRAGHHGSDQGWISYCLGPHEQKWSTADGVYSYKNHLRQMTQLPANARVVSFHGEFDPWDAHVQQRHRWVAEHYR